MTKIPSVTTRDQLTDFKFEFSDKNSSLLVSNIEPVGGNKNQKIHLYALNSSTDQDWGKVVELPYQAKMFDMVSQSIDNQGNVYLLGSQYREGNREKKNGDPNYDYVLMGYSPDGTPSFSHNIISMNKFFRDMRVAVTPNSEIICTGFYSNDKIDFSWTGGGPSVYFSSSSFDRTNPVGGIYYLKLDMETKAVLEEHYNNFTLEFLTQNLDKKETRKAVKKTNKGENSESFSFSLDKLVVRRDGSVTLVGEQNVNKTATQVKYAEPYRRSGATFPERSTTNYYSYMDIIAVHLSPKGELEWAEKIAKKQITVGDLGFFSSYAMAVENDRLHFVFNENRQNLRYNGKGELANFNPRKIRKDAALAIVTLDAQGNKSKRHLAQPAGSAVFLKARSSRQFTEDKLFLFGQYKKDFRLGRLGF